MNERPTPETDVVKFQIGDSSHFAVHVVHARRLERERDEARESLELYKAANSDLKRIARERDEARDAADKAKSYKRVLKDDNAKLRRELDKSKNDADAFVEKWGKSQERAINAERELDELNKRLIEVCQYGVVCTIEREDLRKEIAAERALADRLASVMFGCTARDMNDAYDAWKEARK